MASAAANALPTSCPTKDTVRYDRIVLEATPDMEREIEDAKELLDYALVAMPDEEEYTGKQEEYEKELKRILERSDEMVSKEFPYTMYLADDEDILDREIFKSYTGPVYWNDCGRDFIIDMNQPKENFKPENMAKLKYSSLKPIRIFNGGEDKKLTVGGLCEAVAKLNFNPGDHHYLENIDIQYREIDNKEVMTILFFTGE